jgi:ABC-type proline/glycine betaine transport system ATPase subunit
LLRGGPGITITIVTHDPNEAKALADRVGCPVVAAILHPKQGEEKPPVRATERSLFVSAVRRRDS